jgi:hypothetical protein
MGFELLITFHPRKESGGYDTETTETNELKVGKAFEETPLEKLAGVIMGEMARRDIWVVDVKVVELVRKEIQFKESKDGKGIMLKNKRFSFNEAAQLVAEDVLEVAAQQPHYHHGQHVEVIHSPNTVPSPAQQPHEAMVPHKDQSIDDLYANPNRAVPVQRQNGAAKMPHINPKKVLYEVYFEPYFHEAEAKRLKLKFSEDRKYPVHQIIPSVTGKLDAQKIAVTDDSGKVVVIDEKYFTSAGLGLMADKELGFSGSNGRGVRKPKLAFENEMFIDSQDNQMAATIPSNIPVDDGSVPNEVLKMPDIRPGRKVR